MISTILVTAAIAAPLPQEANDRSSRPLPPVVRTVRPGEQDGSRTIRGIYGEALGSTDAPEEALGGGWSNPFGPAAGLRALPSRVIEVTLNDTGTGWQERFLLGVPRKAQLPAPLLVAFHGYGNTHFDILYNTEYFQKATEKGWYVVAPLGAHKFNFGVAYAQENVKAVLEWVATHVYLDTGRIYGVGFSMGGGVVTSFAARHLDPSGPRFAAVVNHTGSVSVRDVYNHTADTSLLENPLLFGGSPIEEPFAYQRASTIDLFPDGSIGADTDMARNLRHVPVHHWAVSGEPNAYLLDGSIRLHEHLVSKGATSTFDIGVGVEHDWETLDEDLALGFLEQQELTLPPRGTSVPTLADRDGRWFHFDLERALPEDFARFRWTVDALNNRLILDQAANLTTIAFDPLDLELENGQAIEVMLNLEGPTSLDVVVRGFAQMPSSVQRTGGAAQWSWDPDAGTVTLHEVHGVGYPRWTVTP